MVTYRLNILYFTCLLSPFDTNNPRQETKSEYIITIASISSITIALGETKLI